MLNQRFQTWFLCFAVSPTVMFFLCGAQHQNSKGCNSLTECGRHWMSSMWSSDLLLKHQECICWRWSEAGLLYFAAAPPTELTAEVTESLPSLSPSFKSWGWRALRLMRKFTVLTAIVSELQMIQTMIESSAMPVCTLTSVCLVCVPPL